MSLILEALRRSEAERRRGQAPGLLDGDRAPAPRSSAPWPMALGGIAVGLLLAAGLGWWLRAEGEPATMAATVIEPPPITAATNPSRSTPMPEARSVAEPIPRREPPRTTESAPTHEPSRTPEPVPPRTPEPPPVTIPPPPSTPVATPVSPPDGEPTPALPPVAPPPPAAVPAPPAAVAAPPAAVAAPPAAAPDIAPSADTAIGPRTGDLALAELSPALRASLPPLRLSMHVYADDAARRFAIVDGARLREGDAVGDGLRVVEIRRDGLRLAWQGRVLWLPR